MDEDHLTDGLRQIADHGNNHKYKHSTPIYLATMYST